MSLKASLQNIRDQIGKISDLLDDDLEHDETSDDVIGAHADRQPIAPRAHLGEVVNEVDLDYRQPPAEFAESAHLDNDSGSIDTTLTLESDDDWHDERVATEDELEVELAPASTFESDFDYGDDDLDLRKDVKYDSPNLFDDAISESEVDDEPHVEGGNFEIAPEVTLGHHELDSDVAGVSGFGIPDDEDELLDLGDAVQVKHSHTVDEIFGGIVDAVQPDAGTSELLDVEPADTGFVAPDVVAAGDDVESIEVFEADEAVETTALGRSGIKIRDRVVTQLLVKDAVTERQVITCYEEWKRVREAGYHVALWRVLTLDPEIDRERIYEEAASVYAFEFAELKRAEVLHFMERVHGIFEGPNFERMLDLFVIPVAQVADKRTGEVKWVFATHDPTRPDVHKLMRDLGLKRFELQYASEWLIGELITEGFLSKNEYLERLNEDPLVYDMGTTHEDREGLVNEDELEAEINRSSLINLFEATLVEAVHRGASDIHIFPNPDSRIEIHFRVDGELTMWHREDRIHPESFLAVVKDKSQNVDRFEKDTAQDGFIQRKIAEATIRFRVSILPIASHRSGINAESIVIRVLDDRKVLSDLRKLGMLDSAMERFGQAIRQPHGMVILTGPTGSGKSTTLVAALHQVISARVNVLTLEDPVEYLIRGVRQIKLSHHLDMEGALRAVLRHDPDIVMVGEMRDRQTADLAIKLANTGHLTFSTLHTNDAPSAVSRLFKMGIEPFLIAYAINIVVAQRLIRSLCPECKVEEEVNRDLLHALEFSDEEIENSTFFGAGDDPSCATCGGTAFKGRRAVAETLYFSDEIRRLILLAGDTVDERTLRDQAEAEGMLSLQQSAKEIVKMGDTSVAEMMRITGA